jgi:hypothetical protein
MPLYFNLSLDNKKLFPKIDEKYNDNNTYNNNNNNKNKNNVLYEESKIKNESEINQLNFMIQSTSTSTFSKISNDRQNFKRRNKTSKKENRKKNYFKMNQFGLVIFGFIILFCQILCHFLINNYNNHIGGQNNALMTFRNYYGVFNTLLTYIFSLACLANGSREEKDLRNCS